MTLSSFVSTLLRQGPSLLMVVPIRAIPFAGYALVAKSVRPTVRIGAVVTLVVAASVAVAVRPSALRDLLWALATFGYFVAAASATYALAAWAPPRLVRSGALLLFAALAFVVLPAISVQQSVARALVVVGWEIMLSAHSYGVETAGEPRPSLGHALFFLLVNPTVVYSERGVPVATPVRGRALLRMGWGAVVMLGRDAVLLAATSVPLLRTVDLGEVHGVGSYAAFFATQLFLAMGLYCAHSGLASMHIGAMLLFGQRLPERYRAPLLATSPQDFWHRWNTWVGRWAHLYLFTPTVQWAKRRLPRRVVPVVSVVSAFLGVGLLHDLGVSAPDPSHASLRFTVLFAALALVLLVWRAVATLGARLVRATQRRGAFAPSLVSWVACIQVMALFAWLAIPVLRGGPLPRSLREALSRSERAVSALDGRGPPSHCDRRGRGSFGARDEARAPERGRLRARI